VLRFGSTSEDDSPNLPDLRGQFLYNLAQGEIIPRPVTHFSLVCDRTIPIVAQMTASTTGLQEPLSNLGSKLHTMWRYCDVGLPQFFLTEDSLPNLDVEGIAFSPLGGQVTATFYPQFEMRLGHSDRIPDEVFDPPTLTPFWPASGLFDSATFVENYLADANSGPKVVHTREKGFLVSSSEVFTSQTQTTMVYFPWNRNVAPEDRTYFTWRDTAVQTWGARDITDQGMVQPGVPVTYDVALSSVGFPGDQYGIEIAMINDMGPPPGEVEPPGIPTVGLPLLMEFRCYPGESLSVNSFDVSTLMPVLSRPFSRAFSTGGFNQQGTPINKDPDSETAPTGGFVATAAQGTIGQATNPRDNSLYMGQMDLVTRVSRVHSVLFNTNQPNPDYVGTVMDPKPTAQPLGTQVILAFRGDDAASLPLTDDFADVNDLDVYGEPINATNAKFLDNPTWSENISANDNQRLIQVRITFISNPVTELSPRLSGLGIAFRF
jgi:hypothetical protein